MWRFSLFGASPFEIDWFGWGEDLTGVARVTFRSGGQLKSFGCI